MGKFLRVCNLKATFYNTHERFLKFFSVTPPDEEADGVIDEELLNQIMQGLPGVNISEVRKNMEDKDKDKK